MEGRQLVGPEVRLFLLLGVLGGFTTFSTFGYETLSLLRDGDQLKAFGNVTLHVAVGLTAVWLGLVAARLLVRMT